MVRVRLDLAELVSSGTVMDRLFRAVGVPPPSRFKLPSELLGRTASAFYGGVATTLATRVWLPVVVADVSAMFPTCAVLLGLWSVLIADHLVVEDVTNTVRKFLSSPDLADKARSRSTWRRWGLTFVVVRPRGEHWPPPGRPRWAGWEREPFTSESMNQVAVFEKE